MRVEAFFLGSGESRRFAVCWHPERGTTARRAWLFVPPFGEEMNKSRRMVALTAAVLAEQGSMVLRMDLRGCGDSAGLLEQSHWNDWLDDVARGWEWLRARSPEGVGLWSLRAGALLASQSLPRLDPAAPLLLWQPVLAGRQYLAQFLRLRVAADAFSVADPAARATTQGLMQSLRSGAVVDVAGYRLPPGIALPMAEAELSVPPQSSEVIWLEVDSSEQPSLAPASAARIERLSASDRRVVARAVRGPAFWQTQEIEDCPTLADATLEALCATH